MEETRWPSRSTQNNHKGDVLKIIARSVKNPGRDAQLRKLQLSALAISSHLMNDVENARRIARLASEGQQKQKKQASALIATIHGERNPRAIAEARLRERRRLSALSHEIKQELRTR